MDIDIQQPLTLVDPHQVPDIFATGLGAIEDVGGGCDRYTLYARQMIDGEETFIIVARVVVPAASLPTILFLAARHIGLTLVRAAKFVSTTVH